MPINTIVHTNQHSIDRVLNTGLPVTLVFWNEARSPSPSSNSSLEPLAEKYAGRALIAKINAKEEQELVNRFNIQDVPAYAFVKDGNVLETTTLDDPDYVDAWLKHLTDGGARPPKKEQQARQRNSSSSTSHRSTRSGAATNGKPVILTDASFQQTVNGSIPTLVDFWAEWCGPCRMVAPSVEELAKEFSGRAVVGKLNVEENPVTAGQYGIRSIPSLLIFKSGQVVDQIVGAQPLPVLRQRLAAHTN